MADHSTSITDMDVDCLVHCSKFLNLQDVSNLSMSCNYLNRVASSDAVWHRLFRERWPLQAVSSLPTSGAKEAYLGRHTALQKFMFTDPLFADLFMEAKPCNHIYLNKNDLIYSQGSLIHMMKIDRFLEGKDSSVSLSDHRARITCMRLFPLGETSLSRGESLVNENALVTSSCDHTIRLWWKGRCQRSFRGHNGPVSVLSDKLLGDGTTKVFASGGEDGTVRLWSLSSSGNRGQQALKATLYGHERSVVLMSVARYKSSLLVSMSKDSKVRVWDTLSSTSEHDSSCVGRTSVPGAPVGLRCHDSLLYLAAGSSVVVVDLRTMRKAFGTSIKRGSLSSFEIFPPKFLFCTGGLGSAMLWDTRRITETAEGNPVAALHGHTGRVTHIHMDQYKVVTGGPDDPHVNVWEANSGRQTNSLTCPYSPYPPVDGTGCSAMAVDGCRIVTASSIGEHGVLRFHDFNNASTAVFQEEMEEGETASKFWGPQCSHDADESDGSK